MKKTKPILILMLLLALAIQANAAPELNFGTVNVVQGETAILNLSLSGGEETYSGINARILLPAKMTVTDVSKGDLLPDSFIIDWNSFSGVDGNGIAVIAYSGSESFNSQNGCLLKLTVNIASDAPLGNQTVPFVNASSGISNEDGSVSISHTTSNGMIACYDPIEDTDGDGLSNSEEVALGTDFLNLDTDNDGHSDGYEYYVGCDFDNPEDYPFFEYLFVDIEAGNDAYTGHDLGQAKKTIQAAIDAAADGEIIIVKNGIYKGLGNKNLTFGDKNITVRSVNGPQKTIIDCENDGRGFNITGGGGRLQVISGFSIINGNTDNGGAIYLKNSNPTISNCILSNNSAIYGGAIACDQSAPSILSCKIADNEAKVGGGICCYNLSLPKIADCLIQGNSVVDSPPATGGGGIFMSACFLPTSITNCDIIDNTALGGAGIHCTDGSSPNITACRIIGNHSSGLSGGIHLYRGASPTITNCIISENKADDIGGGIVCQDYAEPTITNCTITNNWAAYYGGAVTNHGYASWPQITNSILWGNTAPEVSHYDSVSYCDIDQDGYEGTNGNIRQDPLLLNPESGDFRLDPLSPCIDTAKLIDGLFSDQRGSLRPSNENGIEIANFDIGALECSFFNGETLDCRIKSFEEMVIDSSGLNSHNSCEIHWKDREPFPSNDERITSSGNYDVRVVLVGANGRRIDLNTYSITLTQDGRHSIPCTFGSDHMGKWNVRVEMASDANQFITSDEQIIIHAYAESDLDHDVDIDGLDLAQFAQAFISLDSSADLNDDGFVDTDDFTVFAGNFGKIQGH